MNNVAVIVRLSKADSTEQSAEAASLKKDIYVKTDA